MGILISWPGRCAHCAHARPDASESLQGRRQKAETISPIRPVNCNKRNHITTTVLASLSSQPLQDLLSFLPALSQTRQAELAWSVFFTKVIKANTESNIPSTFLNTLSANTRCRSSSLAARIYLASQTRANVPVPSVLTRAKSSGRKRSECPKSDERVISDTSCDWLPPQCGAF